MLYINTFNAQFHVNWSSTWTLNVILFCFHSLAFLFAMDLASIKFPFCLMFHCTLVRCIWIARDALVHLHQLICWWDQSVSITVHIYVFGFQCYCSLLKLSIKVNYPRFCFCLQCNCFYRRFQMKLRNEINLAICIEIIIYALRFNNQDEFTVFS